MSEINMNFCEKGVGNNHDFRLVKTETESWYECNLCGFQGNHVKRGAKNRIFEVNLETGERREWKL